MSFGSEIAAECARQAGCLLTVTCGQELRVERYGGGTRYACPVCDRGHNGHVSTILWTNGQAPKSGRCERLVVNRG